MGLRIAVAGTGFIGRVHARSARLAGAELAGVAASSPESAERAAAELGAARAFASADELVTADGIDVVHLCTPNHLHEPLALAALAAGKHVVCEKPVALDGGGGRRARARPGPPRYVPAGLAAQRRRHQLARRARPGRRLPGLRRHRLALVRPRRVHLPRPPPPPAGPPR